MSRIKLNEYDKAFIIGNNDKLFVRQMSKHLDVSDNSIREFLKENNMPTLYQRTKPVKSKTLQEDQELFLKDNCCDMTASELARAVNNTCYAVNKYLKSVNLKAKKEKLRDIPPMPGQYDIVKQKFERAPAVYSNKQFN